VRSPTLALLLTLLSVCPAPPAPTPGPRLAPSRPAPILPRGDAPGAPGAPGRWTSGAKEGIGSAASPSSRVWFTLLGGRVSEVYYPQLDRAQLRGLALAVRDERGRVWFEGEDAAPGARLASSLELLDEQALLYRQTSTPPDRSFTLRKTVYCDPARDVLLVEVELEAKRREALGLFVLADPALANTASGDSAFAEEGALTAEEAGRKEALAAALVGSERFLVSSVGFAGRSDGASDLRRHGRLTWAYARAARGNVTLAAELAPAAHQTLALGFARSRRDALAAARASLASGFARARAEYVRGWRELLAPLTLPRDPRYRRQARIAAMVLYAHEDKLQRGAMIASLSIPWGEAISADRAEVGGYHLVWARDLYQVATAFLAMGDRAAAGRALDYLLKVQQRPDGSFPQNSWLDGRPYWGSLQLDEVAYPIVLAWRLGRSDRESWEKHLRPAADLLVARGPATPQERWEEEAGYSPSTIAAELAGLVCAAELARGNGDRERAARYLKTADGWERKLERWLVTRSGRLDDALADGKDRTLGYYLRVNDDTDPDDGATLELNNGGGSFDEREVVDAGFLELVRLGVRPADDPTILRSLRVVDRVIRFEAPQGPIFYRYNHDGYGEKADGRPYDGSGVGRPWPLLSGERGEHELALGRRDEARRYLDALAGSAGPGGMIPEQIWDRTSPSPAGARLGQGTGSATPLAWAMAGFLRLALGLEQGKLLEQPEPVARRYLSRPR
jgi:glucoamylase